MLYRGKRRTGATVGIEPVVSSLAGVSLPPLVAFRSAKARTPGSPRVQSRAESGGSGLATAWQRDVALLSTHPGKARFASEASGNGNFTVLGTRFPGMGPVN